MLRDYHQGLPRRERRIDLWRLDQSCHGRQRLLLIRVHVNSVYQRLARRPVNQVREYLERGGLSRSIGTEKADALCSFNPEVQIVEGSERVILLGEFDGLD